VTPVMKVKLSVSGDALEKGITEVSPRGIA
jgi:hypothetical protein